MDSNYRFRCEAVTDGVASRAALTSFGAWTRAVFRVLSVRGNLSLGRH